MPKGRVPTSSFYACYPRNIVGPVMLLRDKENILFTSASKFQYRFYWGRLHLNAICLPGFKQWLAQKRACKWVLISCRLNTTKIQR